ncbi:MAG: protein kinase, partial [Acidobacteriaceae bacterium]|nr:protein kinase [Acidobacteriaceae bacterium]
MLQFGADWSRKLQIAWEDSERAFFRGSRVDPDGNENRILAVVPAAEHPTPSSIERLKHEYALRDELDRSWAVRPIELVRESGTAMLVFEDPGGHPLQDLIGKPLELGTLLRLAIQIAAAVAKMHHRGLLHKDIKPANILVDCGDGGVRLTGFGL